LPVEKLQRLALQDRISAIGAETGPQEERRIR
jgi:hypothetical protein